VSEARNILVGLDGSPQAEGALDVAIELAIANHGRLTILTAAPQLPYLACTGASPEGVTALKRSMESGAERMLCRAVERVPDNVSVTTIFTPRPIREALISRIEDGSHDLVVLGSRDRGRICSALLGSVSRFALRHSPVPVLVVRAPSPREGDSRPRRPGSSLRRSRPAPLRALPR
jgi:nucleotide-binding universal stress UspA family protein